MLGKWLATEPSVLMLDEPTQGVDIGAKAEIHRLIDELVAQGHGVLLISSDLAELVGMADRLLVMRRGRIVRTLERGWHRDRSAGLRRHRGRRACTLTVPANCPSSPR